ncbi:YgzB family protein [Bacillaceae bacterium SIJ1]|uniref:YgzB family protein n=1 Tax=Litoribacterium kuwaitense TaxID=1398745 RepID=UPI0013EC8384|nr:YgzB family protein [Litoribacterium kuwaitense]NGP46584.1 YgzB family protein [Litoribacterium kuwaitense]
MNILFKNKINKIRTFALALIFLGIGVMYIGLFFKESPIWMTVFMLFGVIFILLSTAVYVWIGLLSTRAVQVVCPSCQKYTKVLGRVDACMHCSQPLTMDKSLDGKEFDESYNRQRKEAKQTSQK